MKKINIILVLIFSSFFYRIYAQDMIFLQRGDLIKAKIIQKSEDFLIYKLYESPDTTSRNMKMYEIATIRYEDGRVEIIQVNPRRSKPWALLINFLGPAITLGVVVEYFPHPSWSVEAGLDLIGVHGGVRYHFLGETNKFWTPYVGAYGFTNILFNGFYFPVGAHYAGINGFTFSIEGAIINAQINWPFFNQRREVFPYVGCKLGFRL